MRWIGSMFREILFVLSASPQSRWRQLRRLRGLDDRLLDDVGITRQQASEQPLLPGGNRESDEIRSTQKQPPPLRHEPQGALKPWR